MATPKKITGTNEQGNIITDVATGITASGPELRRVSGQAGINLSSLERQPKSSNGLLPTSYKFALARIPHASFFCQSINLPGIRIEKGIQGSPHQFHLGRKDEELDGNYKLDAKSIANHLTWSRCCVAP